MKICLVSMSWTKGQEIAFLLNSREIESIYFYPYKSPEMKQFGESKQEVKKYVDYVYNKYDAFLEFPYCMFFDYLYEKDNDTKFIYVNLPKQNWIDAMLQSAIDYGHDGPPYAFEEFYCKNYIETGKTKVQDLTPEELGQIYDAHENAINLFFQDKGSILRVDYNDEYFSTKVTDYISQ